MEDFGVTKSMVARMADIPCGVLSFYIRTNVVPAPSHYYYEYLKPRYTVPEANAVVATIKEQQSRKPRGLPAKKSQTSKV